MASASGLASADALWVRPPAAETAHPVEAEARPPGADTPRPCCVLPQFPARTLRRQNNAGFTALGLGTLRRTVGRQLEHPFLLSAAEKGSLVF